MATIQWLASTQQNRHEIAGELFCPLHAWRAWEVAHLAAQPSTGSVGEWHHHLAVLLVHALDMLVAQVAEASSHVDVTGWRGALTSLLGKKRRGLLWERPSCPLCAATEQEQSDETGVLDTFGASYAQLSSSNRQKVASRLCPRDRRLARFFTPAIAEFLPKPQYPLTGYLPQWWLVEPEIAKADSAFVRRLLERDPHIPDEDCPACFVRVEHEHALLAELRRKRASGESIPEMGALVEDLCSRHTALLQLGAETQETADESRVEREGSATSVIPLRWPAGTLRPVSRGSGCLICTTLWGWDLLRMEGLRRAAGGIFLDVGSAERLAATLDAHHYLFCLPHWQQITAAAFLEVTPPAVTDTAARFAQAACRDACTPEATG